MKFALKNYYPILFVCALAIAGLLVTVGYRTFAGDTSDPTPKGFVAIPSDLILEYEPLAREFEGAQKRIEDARKEADRVRPRIEQILRITLDRAGVKADDFGKYEFDQKLKGFKPAPTPVPPPTTR
ncbi:MAG: hypothetical protein L0Y56_02710 [Nitrospira sp.]|nr:hypothetical protein [Nitrospira sp.]